MTKRLLHHRSRIFIDFDKNLIVGFVFWLTVIAAGVIAVRQGETWPIVYKSWSEGRCVNVESSEQYDCSSLPEHYHLVWVK